MSSQQASLTRRVFGLPRAAWVICIGMFINKLGNFLSVFLVLYLTAKGYSIFQAGIALGAIGLGSFFGNGVGGTVADRIGRRWTIIVSMFSTAGFTMLVPFVSGIYPIIGLAVIIGFVGQLYRPAGGAILVDTVGESDRIAAFALLRLAINLGMAVGPVIGGLLSNASYNYLFIGNAATSFLFGFLVLLLLPETKPVHEVPAEGAPAALKGGYRDVFTDPSMRFYLLAVLASTYVYIQTVATLPLRVKDLHLSNEFYGLLLGINALIIVLVELPLVKFTERRSQVRVMALGLVLLAFGVGLTGAADGRVALIGTVVLWTFGEMVYSPVATAFPGALAPDHLRARYQGAEGIAVTLGQTAGPALGGFLFAVSATGHWLSCGAIALVGAGLILAAKPRRRVTEAEMIDALDEMPDQTVAGR